MARIPGEDECYWWNQEKTWAGRGIIALWNTSPPYACAEINSVELVQIAAIEHNLLVACSISMIAHRHRLVQFSCITLAVVLCEVQPCKAGKVGRYMIKHSQYTAVHILVEGLCRCRVFIKDIIAPARVIPDITVPGDEWYRESGAVRQETLFIRLYTSSVVLLCQTFNFGYLSSYPLYTYADAHWDTCVICIRYMLSPLFP